MKGQSDIVGMVLVVLISISLLSLAYTWGMPLIQKKQDTTKYERVFSIFDPNNPNSFERKIIYVANTESDYVFSSDYSGNWILDQNENSVSFSFVSKVTGVKASNEWFSLIPSKSCLANQEGVLGVDEPFVVCVKSKPIGDSYEITFKIWFINLTDTSQGKKYYIELFPVSLATSEGKTVRIQFQTHFEDNQISKDRVGLVLL